MQLFFFMNQSKLSYLHSLTGKQKRNGEEEGQVQGRTEVSQKVCVRDLHACLEKRIAYETVKGSQTLFVSCQS